MRSQTGRRSTLALTVLVTLGASQALGQVPNFRAVAIQINDTQWNPTQVRAGVPFIPQLIYDYTNPLPVGNPYGIRFTIHGWHRDLTQTWRNGSPPGTYRVASGGWTDYVFEGGGTLTITVEIDPDNLVQESDETDNRLTMQVPVQGGLPLEWEQVGAVTGVGPLGDGTDVVVGTMDDALDLGHPLFTGLDSRGRPRLIAARQQATGPLGTPNSDHATRVMANVFARARTLGDFRGLAPDARFVTAEFLDRANTGVWVQSVTNAAGFLAANGAEVINMSWSWHFDVPASLRGDDHVNLLVDYLAYGRGIVCVAAVNQLTWPTTPTAPGSSRNALTVGGLEDVTAVGQPLRAWQPMNHGPTTDGRSKPDLLSTDAVATPCLATRGQLAQNTPHFFPCTTATSGCAPVVTGAVAQMLDYAKRTGQSRDPKVIKAVVLTSCRKAQDANGAPWANSPTQPLDDEQGAGVLDLGRVHRIYSAGQARPGYAGNAGYDLNMVSGTNTVTYHLGSLRSPGGKLDATLVWQRHTDWHDNNASRVIDDGDTFSVPANDQQDDLDLRVLRDGVLIAESRSRVDNVEHLHLPVASAGYYSLEVVRRALPGTGTDEEFALAWDADGGFFAVDLQPTQASFVAGTPIGLQCTGGGPGLPGLLLLTAFGPPPTPLAPPIFLAAGSFSPSRLLAWAVPTPAIAAGYSFSFEALALLAPTVLGRTAAPVVVPLR